MQLREHGNDKGVHETKLCILFMSLSVFIRTD